VFSAAAHIEQQEQIDWSFRGLKLVNPLQKSILINQKVLLLQAGYAPVGVAVLHGNVVCMD
jgi:hypothetical protein